MRVLQEGEGVRIGESKPIGVNVRVVAATNRMLVEEMGEGRFQEDLCRSGQLAVEAAIAASVAYQEAGIHSRLLIEVS